MAGQKEVRIFWVAYYISLLQNCIRTHLPCAEKAVRYVYNTNAPLVAQAPQALGSICLMLVTLHQGPIYRGSGKFGEESLIHHLQCPFMSSKEAGWAR